MQRLIGAMAIHDAPVRSGNGNGNGTLSALANAPLWAKLLGVLGPSAFIALYLVYVGAQSIPMLQQSMVIVIANQEKILTTLRDISAQQQETIRIIQRTCVNAGKDVAERNACWPQPKGQ